MTDADRVSKLVQDAIDDFDGPGVTLAVNLRRCQRIASLRGDARNLTWLTLEGRDLQAEVKGPKDRLVDRLVKDLPEAERVALAGKQVDAYSRRRQLDGEDGQMYGRSLEQMETHVAGLRREEAALTTPDGMHSLDLGLRLDRNDKMRTKLFEMYFPLENILSRVRIALWDFLVETEWQLTFGEATAETFDRLRVYVDQQLTALAPPALEQFQSAYRGLKEGTPEARALAVTSCRRVLKTLADQLYPARDEKVVGADGKARDVKEDNVINRLAQFVTESVGKHGNGAVVQAAVEDVGQRVHALVGLASKGVHADIADYEVDTCVVQTYLVVADLLRIRERSRVVPSQEPVPEVVSPAG